MSLKTYRFLCWLVLATAFLAGCAQNGRRVSSETGETQISPEAARKERERPQIEAPRPEPPRPPVVPSQGDCAPPADNKVTFGACCNNTPCVGQCVQAAEGKIECDCFGVRGGCQQGQVCCKIRRGCVPADQCDVP